MKSSFLQSKLYESFWLFLLKSACVVGLAFSLGITLWEILAQGNFGPSAGLSVYIFFVSAAYGAIAAIIGFWVVYVLLKLKVPLPFDVIVALVGIVLGLVILTVFYQGTGIEVGPPFRILFFPLIPFILSLFAFIELSRAHVLPFT